MRNIFFAALALCCLCGPAAAQRPQLKSGDAEDDSTDVFFRHLQLSEVVVTGVTGQTKQKHASAPITLVNARDMRTAPALNPVDMVAHLPGMAQVTTGNGISKPIIRGLGYNRVVVMNDGVRQEGQQWGDEHGLEVDGHSIYSAEVMKGPASLMYGSDAMAGVLILHDAPLPAEGEMRGEAAAEYQTNSGLYGYTLNLASNKSGFVWDARYSERAAHAYKNRYDGYVPGSQFHERNGRLKLGLSKGWGHSHLIGSLYHQRPGIVEGERDPLSGELECDGNVKTYGRALPFQQVNHYKAVWDNSLNLPKGWLKAIVGYQQNRRQEFEEATDECELDFKLHTLTYDIRYLTQEFSGFKLSAGAGGMFQQSLNLGEEMLIPEYKLFDIGLFATGSKTWDNVSLNAGLRYDHRHLDFHQRNFQTVTGSMGAVWNISPQWNLRLNAARGYRAPNMSELGSDGVHEGTLRYEVGNAGLKAEHSMQADLGADFTSRYFSFQVALFANRIDNYIFAAR
ncbi:MAG: TonB-dependent receptor, partial [Bacteroidaceae bacterium]|nr:TonB-dependent receptor [Bacteroidaceae bacterium]